MKKVKLEDIKLNPENHRNISAEDMEKLCSSIREFPEMMELRPIVIDNNNIVLGGNMRYKALKKLGYSEVDEKWIKKAEDLTDEQKKEFQIKDNVASGEWDWENLINSGDYDLDKLEDWGLDVPIEEQLDDADDGETIELPKSEQIEPPQEYIVILAEPNSEEWEELIEMLDLKLVRRGGYKKGSPFDSHGIERVLPWQVLKKRLKINTETEEE